MNYFCKAKFPEIQTVQGTVTPVPAKLRTDNRDRAFEWAAKQLKLGATSITIRPE